MFGAKEGYQCSSGYRLENPSESAVLLQNSLDMDVTSSSYPYGVSSNAIRAVRDVIACQAKLVDMYGAKLKHLHFDKKKTLMLLIGLQF